jgi:SAM-dependent methyltransferase
MWEITTAAFKPTDSTAIIMQGGNMTDPMLALLPNDTERGRYTTLLKTLDTWRHLFAGKRCLDFGASWGTSMVALVRQEAAEVVGTEPSADRVAQGKSRIARAAPGAKLSLIQTSYEPSLPLNDGEFAFILANGVIEHIPQPRDVYLRELWRVLAPGGHLMINETPNKYFPKELHTTDLWFNHWLPRSVAHRRAVRSGRFDSRRTDWDSSGWRGLGYYELVRPLGKYRLIPEQAKLRHRILAGIGLPPSLIDPYPTWILQKI